MGKLIIIVFAYNEEKTIRNVLSSIPREFVGVDSVEIAVIDDGSTDDSLKNIAHGDVRIVRHEKNEGLGKSFQDGVWYALEHEADFLVSIDGDGQFDPCDIPKLLQPLLQNRADFVTASRFIDKKYLPAMPQIKKWGNYGMSFFISWILRKKFYDVSCGFRAYNKEALLRLNLFGHFTYTHEVFLYLGFKGLRMAEVPIQVKYFPERKSRVASNLFSYSWRSFKIIFRAVRDYKPLKFFGGLGLAVFVLGIILDIVMVWYYFATGKFTPYKIIGFTGAFLNLLGIIIFILGLLADMLYRIRIIQERVLYYEKSKRYKQRMP